MITKNIAIGSYYRVIAKGYPSEYADVIVISDLGACKNGDNHYRCKVINSHWSGISVGTLEVFTSDHYWQGLLSLPHYIDKLCIILGHNTNEC